MPGIGVIYMGTGCPIYDGTPQSNPESVGPPHLATDGRRGGIGLSAPEAGPALRPIRTVARRERCCSSPSPRRNPTRA